MYPLGELAVLVVDPDGSDRDATVAALTASDSTDTAITVESAETVDGAIDAFATQEFDCLVTEYDLPDATGLELVQWIRSHAPDTPCILYTDTTPEAIQTTAFEDVVVEYLPKDMPDSATSLARLVGNVVSQHGQIAYPIPDTEDERLAALEHYDIDGLETKAAVDRITTLVKEHFDIAVAFAGVIDAHEERFLACQGAEWESLDRENTICTHTILEDEYMIVENVQADTRFAGTEELEDLNIRSYAGVPLKTPGGLPIGALCLVHDEPRGYDDDDIEVLQLFADELMEQLELRRRLAERPQETEANR